MMLGSENQAPNRTRLSTFSPGGSSALDLYGYASAVLDLPAHDFDAGARPRGGGAAPAPRGERTSRFDEAGRTSEGAGCASEEATRRFGGSDPALRRKRPARRRALPANPP